MATAPTANDLTRQQLDELDALLQRMLTLPLPAPDKSMPTLPTSSASVGTLPLPDPVVPATVKNWRFDPATPAPNAAPHLSIVPSFTEPVVPQQRRVPEPALPPEPARPLIPELPRQSPSPTPTSVSHLPFAEPVIEPPQPAPLSVFGPKPISTPTKQEPPVVSLKSKPYTPSPYADVSPLFWPLAIVNQIADAILGLCGPPGKLLRSGFGKNVLGLAGLGLLLYTAGHVAQLRGWVLLPMPLPWPR